VKSVNDHIYIAESVGGLKKMTHKLKESGPSLADSLRVLETLRQSNEQKAKEPMTQKLGHVPIPS